MRKAERRFKNAESTVWYEHCRPPLTEDAATKLTITLSLYTRLCKSDIIRRTSSRMCPFRVRKGNVGRISDTNIVTLKNLRALALLGSLVSSSAASSGPVDLAWGNQSHMQR